MKLERPEPTIREHIYYFFHRSYTLIEFRKGEKTSRMTIIYNCRLAIKIARASNAVHYMLYRRTAYGEMGKLVMEGHRFGGAE